MSVFEITRGNYPESINAALYLERQKKGAAPVRKRENIRGREILQMFAGKRQIARQKYRRFIADGVAMGKRNELVGGGLHRSRKFYGAEGFEAYDERILGSGDFVKQLWKESGTNRGV